MSLHRPRNNNRKSDADVSDGMAEWWKEEKKWVVLQIIHSTFIISSLLR